MLRSLLLATTLSLSVVTAAVTQPAGVFRAVITDNLDGSRMAYKAVTWPDQNRCDAALGNWPEVFQAIAALRADPAIKVPPVNSPDGPLSSSLQALVLSYMLNHGNDLPSYSLSCELLGDPA